MIAYYLILFLILTIVLLSIALIDLYKYRNESKKVFIFWFIIIFLVPVLGALFYFQMRKYSFVKN